MFSKLGENDVKFTLSQVTESSFGFFQNTRSILDKRETNLLLGILLWWSHMARLPTC